MRHALLAALLILAGCANARPCRTGTVMLTLTLDANTSEADQLHVAVVMPDGTPLADDVAFHPGTLKGTLEIDLPSYPAGQSIELTVTAERGGVALGEVGTGATLDPRCLAIGLTLSGFGDGGADGPQPDLFTPQMTGTACASDAACLSGHCVDGYCCETACAGACEACDVAGALGTCTPVTSGQPHGARPQCDSDGTACGGTCDPSSTTACVYPGSATMCRAFSCVGTTVTFAAYCDGAGHCPAVTTTMCSTTCSNNACLNVCAVDTDCSNASLPYCNPGGVCRATKPNGRTCASGSECTSAQCIDGACCNSACSGQCQACNVAGNLGACTTVTSGNAHGSRTGCPGYGTTCGASCTGASATSCTYSTAQCRAQSCSGATLTRAASCASGSCPAVTTASCGQYLCNSTGTDCYTSCSSPSQCRAGDECYSSACCVPSCGFKECGPDGCGGSCGACGSGEHCVGGACEPTCVKCLPP